MCAKGNEQREHLHGLHGVLDELHPGVALVLGAGQHLHHLRLLDARRDEEEAALLVGHLPHDQLLEGDNRGALVLQGGEGRGGERGGGVRDSGRVEEQEESEEEEEEGGKTNVEEEQEEKGQCGGKKKKEHVQREIQG